MSFRILENSNIVNFEGEAIVNSLGIDVNEPGAICKSITDKINSRELNNRIAKMNYICSVGDFFIYTLTPLERDRLHRFKHVLNIVMPKYEYDDKYIIYKDMIKLIFNECHKNKWKKVGIPLLGAGANGYDSEEIAKIIQEMAEEYSWNYGGIDFILVRPTNEIVQKNNERLDSRKNEDGSFHTGDINSKFNRDQRYIKKQHRRYKNYNKTFFAYNEYEKGFKNVSFDETDLRGVKCIDQYIDAFLEKKHKLNRSYPHPLTMKERIYLFLGYDGTNSNKNYRHSGVDAYGDFKTKISTKPIMLYKISLALKMSEKEAKEFLNYFGYNFPNPNIDKVAGIIQNLIKERVFDIVEIEKIFLKEREKDRNIYSIFNKNKIFGKKN